MTWHKAPEVWKGGKAYFRVLDQRIFNGEHRTYRVIWDRSTKLWKAQVFDKLSTYENQFRFLKAFKTEKEAKNYVVKEL